MEEKTKKIIIIIIIMSCSWGIVRVGFWAVVIEHLIKTLGYEKISLTFPSRRRRNIEARDLGHLDTRAVASKWSMVELVDSLEC